MVNTALQQGQEKRHNLDPEEQKSAGEKLIWPETHGIRVPFRSEESIGLHHDREVPGCACGKASRLKAFAGIAGAAVVTTLIILTVLASRSYVTGSPSPATWYPASCGPSCPDGWVGYRRKCYFFSETEGNWTDSRKQCSALNASLALIESEQELIFMLRFKVRTDPWIGLRREPGQGWKWANGLEFNTLFVIRGEADCAFLSEDTVSSSRCYTERNWICSAPESHAKGVDTSGEGTREAPG